MANILEFWTLEQMLALAFLSPRQPMILPPVRDQAAFSYRQPLSLSTAIALRKPVDSRLAKPLTRPLIIASARMAAVSQVAPVSSSLPKETERTGSILKIVEQLRSTGKDELPKEFTVRETERPTIMHDEWKDFADIPVIDLSLLQTDRARVVQQVYTAVTEWGFFQILNHSLPLEVRKEARAQAVKFFELPLEMKERFPIQGLLGYVGDCSKQSVLSLHWAEMLSVPLETLEQSIRQVWPDGNQAFGDTVTKFCSGAEVIAKQVSELIAESLGLSADFFSQNGLERIQLLRLLYYPACPRPTDSLGCTSHTDRNFITVLLQDEVGGLQIEKDGQWIGIKPIEGALVVNIGDMLHAWTNGICKSVLHRVVVNKDVSRLSLGVFMTVDNQQRPISAPDELIDDNHPRLYKTLTPSEYSENLSQYRNEDKTTDRNGVAFLGAKFKFED